MALSEEAIRRLTALGYTTEADLEFWRRLWMSEGDSFFWYFLESEEKSAESSTAGTRNSGRSRPSADGSGQHPTPKPCRWPSREQYRILCEKMEQFAASPDRVVMGRKPNQADIVATTPVGLAAASAVFGRLGVPVVLLLGEEKEGWFSRVIAPEEQAFGWYATYWWLCKEEPEPEELDEVRRHYPIPDGSAYWVVTTGLAWGSLAGGSKDELWQWDGVKASCLGIYRDITY